jgi:hypothetical protein
MTQAIDDLRAMPELDASSGAFVNDTAPGVDGSVLGVNTVPASAEEDTAGQRYALTTGPRSRGLLAAAIGGGLLALIVAFVGGGLRPRRGFWPRRSRTFAGSLRGRPRRWVFAR